ncbi:MAG: hypothetical protein HY319_04300 [Armatimonadetes bacterium]|nr:hypothetical protein [Armatimonadota bacterium]
MDARSVPEYYAAQDLAKRLKSELTSCGGFLEPLTERLTELSFQARAYPDMKSMLETATTVGKAYRAFPLRLPEAASEALVGRLGSVAQARVEKLKADNAPAEQWVATAVELNALEESAREMVDEKVARLLSHAAYQASMASMDQERS